MNAPSGRNSSRFSRVAGVTLLVSLAALVVCVCVALFFLPLMGLIGISIVIGAAAFSLVIGLHYLLWGWWLARALREPTDESAESRQ
jgi:hypothetical protein